MTITLVSGGKSQKVDPKEMVITAALDSPLELVVAREGFKPYRNEFSISSQASKGNREWPIEVQLDPVQFGFLTIFTIPSSEAIIRPLDAQNRVIASDTGRPWTLKTPIENEKFPAGSYSIRLVNDVLGMEKTVVIQVQEGKSVRREEHLEVKN